MTEYSIIGKPVPMVDGNSKVTGRGIYTDDLKFPGMLYARIFRSVHPHAKILKLDTTRAEEMPGVVAVVTGKEMQQKYGILPVGHDETALAVDKVRYVGEGVVAIAATSPETAEAALQRIEVVYEPLPAYFDAFKAMEDGAVLIHDDRPNNIEREYHHDFGNVEEGFRTADLVRQDSFFCPRVTHAAMEPHSTVANYEAGKVNGLVLYSDSVLSTSYYISSTRHPNEPDPRHQAPCWRRLRRQRTSR